MSIKVPQFISEEEMHEYEFTFIDMTIVFTHWYKSIRPKGKRKWVVVSLWNQYAKRDSTAPEPELTEEIRLKAFAEFTHRITVKTWKEFRPNL